MVRRNYKLISNEPDGRIKNILILFNVFLILLIIKLYIGAQIVL